MAKTKIPSKTLKELNRQFNYELTAPHACLAMSVWRANRSLKGFAGFFAKQAGEGREHAENRTEQSETANLSGAPSGRHTWEAGVRFRKMLMIRDTLSWYCGSLFSFFQAGESRNPFQCFWCSSRFSPDNM